MTTFSKIVLAANNMIFAILLLANFTFAQDRAWIGIDVQDRHSPVRGFHVLVTSITEGSPAEESGIKKDDILISVKNNAIKNRADLINVLALLSPGENVEFIILRNGENIKLSVNMGIHPQNNEANEEIKKEIEKITELLKANKLEESIEQCGIKISQDGYEMSGLENVILKLGMYIPANLGNDSLKEKYYDLCKKQLVDKVRKLPKNKINTPILASIYYDKYYRLYAKIFQNDGKMILGTGALGNTVMIQIPKPIIGECTLTDNQYIPFLGYVKPLGNKTYTSLLGKQTVPNYQLLWCGGDLE